MQAAAGLLATAVPDDRGRDGVERIDLDDPDGEPGVWPDEEEDR
jgi:hypothetical protein